MTTPMFEQFHRLKASQPNAILFFRMGDFYEMFFDDAVVAARELELTLTSRNKADPNPIPMAGVPHHAAAGYIQRLTDLGFRVAIAEQKPDPNAPRGMMQREIVRVVTPGIVLDPAGLAGNVPNWLAAVCRTEHGYGVCFLDASTGAARITAVPQLPHVEAEMGRMEPAEILIGPGVSLDVEPKQLAKGSDELWKAEVAGRELKLVEVVGDAGESPELLSLGAALGYARSLQAPVDHLQQVERYEVSGFMVLDATTRRNLELVRTVLGGQRRGSLIAFLDRCVTRIGSRQLLSWLDFPLLDPQRVEHRSAAVAELVEESPVREDLAGQLRSVADIERLATRVMNRTAHARDLAALSRSLAAAPGVLGLAAKLRRVAPFVSADPASDLANELGRWLVDDPPISLTDGGVIRQGAHAGLDELIELSMSGMSRMDELGEREREETGISTLKIRSNKVFGFFIEVTKAHLHRVPERYMRKQTLSNCERYITAELKELEEKVLGADERRKQLEYELFVDLRERTRDWVPALQKLSRALAQLDALVALAEIAVRHRWVRPTVDASRELRIEAGRHPMVEASLEAGGFVPNDVQLRPETRQLIVLTGPNMSGKSTVLRQTALIALLAQIGSFVPADAAHIGICDRVFTRVGAADDLRKGQSTFMVEMAETASILHHATDRTLVIMDEIGRGTSTYDGLAIAWSVAEDLADRVRCRALFATHYHELCELAELREAVVNQSVAVVEHGSDILFLRKLKDGGASRSYGIACARLAGLPQPVVERATALLKGFEKTAPRNEREQLSLFGSPVALAAEPDPEPAAPSALLAELSTMQPDDLSPRAAHAALYELVAKARAELG